MGFLKKIFTWWDGSTIGTDLFTRRFGRQVGTDLGGNIYYQSKDGAKRWVIYKGANDASRIPAQWYSWIHHQIDGLPDESLPPVRTWEKAPTPNLTGTDQAYRPPGALERGGRRAAATGDYQAWVPE